jgi:hypothetical protein
MFTPQPKFEFAIWISNGSFSLPLHNTNFTPILWSNSPMAAPWCCNTKALTFSALLPREYSKSENIHD